MGASDLVLPREGDSAGNRARQALDAAVSALAASPMSNGVLSEVSPGADGPVTVPHGIGRKANGVLIMSADRGAYIASLLSSDARSAQVSITPQWELVERKDFFESGSSFDFAARLNGDLDYEYRIDSFWKSGATTNVLRLRVNGGSSGSLTNCHSRYHLDSASSSTTTGFAMSRMQSAVISEHRIESFLFAGTGDNRLFRSIASQTDGTSAADTDYFTAGGKWEDTATVITSLGADLGTSLHIAAGSHFTLYRRPRLKGRKLKLWIF